MKKITLLLLTLFFSIASYSQLGGTGVEGFESTTGPDASPSTNWTLGTGNWYVFNNVSSATTRWGITSAATTPPQVNSGTNAAYCIRSTSFPDGQIENYLATPLVNIPSNGQLHFWTRNFLIGTQGTVFQIKVAPSTANPTDPNSYSLVQQWTDADLVTTFNIYEEKVVNLAAFQGLQVYVAFVMQQDPILSPFGDRWFIDDVSIVEQCFDPTNLTANNITLTSAELSWGNPSGATSWEIEIVPAASSPTGTGIVYNNATPTYTATATQPAGVAFTATTSYKYYVRAICSGGTTSAWIGPYSFATTSPGLSCNAPIQVTSLPYSTTDSTANYSDNPTIEGSPGTSCGITGNYLNGNDVVYSYTAPANGTISVTMTPTGNNSGIFAYSSCANIGTTCLNGAAGTTATVRTFNLPVTAGQTYYFVISSLNTTQTVGYTLVIQTVNCAPPTNLAVSGITQTGANLNWAAGGSTSWEVVVQPAGAGIPSGAGITTTNNTAYPTPNPLTPNTNYEFYVRADCNDGSGNFSAWTGPFVFRTLCTAFNVPFQEGFNSTSTTEACWTVLNVNADTDAWDMNYATNPFEGNQSASILTNLNAGNNDDWLISPQINITGNQRLKFHYRVQSATDPDAFRVMLSYDGPSPVDFTTQLLPLTTFTNVTYQQAIINLPTTPGAINIGWHIPPGGIDGNRLYIDNVIIEDIPTCPEPSFLTSSAVLSTSATLTWTNGGAETEWQVLALPCGSPAPTATSTGFVTTTTGSPYNLTGLSPTTCYDVYVRAVCPGPDESPWTGPTTFTTQVAPPVCGGQYIDAGGIAANYPNNSDSTVTICPTTPGDVVTVTFTSFNTETNWDAVYVFDGNSIAAPQIASTNGAGNVPGGLAGGYWGTTIPGPFTSTSADGCLTFRFRSDGSVNNPGWVANVTCAPPPTCRRPTAIVSSAVTHNTVNLTWTQPVNPDNSVASQWEVLALPCGSPAPTATATGFVTANTNNSFTLTGLNPDTCYDIYIRAVCSTTDSSEWGGPVTITTQIAPPVCGGTFTDAAGANANYANNSNSTVIICPTNPNEVVTVTFTSFFTEANWDALYVFDGNSTSAPQIASTNGAGNVPGGLAGGYWGNLNTNLPGPFTSSSPTGCLTFNFRSDGSVNNPGWVANVTCEPAPTCPRPTALTFSAVTQTSFTVGWTEVGTATQWEVLILPAGSPAPTSTDTGVITTTNTYVATNLTSATAYDVYIRSICSSTDVSTWSIKGTVRTLIENDECFNAINVPVNPDTNCGQTVSGTVIGATASSQGNTCGGTDDDDVWFSFVATSSSHSIDLTNVAGSTTDLFHVLYSGSCSALTQIYCSDPNSSIANNLVPGQTYYIRVYTWTATANQTSTFNVCIGTIPPPISTSTTLYTNPQLVEDVLLDSTCALVSNITWSTGTNFGSTNGISYFNQNGSSFPFGEGVVLTTGNAMSAPGPNTTTLSDGNAAWTGDAQLEAIILAATGNPMNSRNATKLEFDFVPIINTLSFNFIFASEEYGTFQCDYSDAFAFLLTNTTTGVTTNLAVLPNTTTPISVVTIRDNQFNNACNSQNPQYFGNYYVLPNGSNPIGAPINFNGMTVPLTATSPVVPGQLYHIKLVIADRLDNLFDSAVFIEGGSFNIGTVDLGNDLLQETNNAICFGETQLLDSGLSSNDFTFTWMLGSDIIPNETGPSLVVTQPGSYTLTAQYNNTTCTATDTILVEFYPEIIGGQPNDLIECGVNGVATFDLTVNTPIILNGNNPSDYTVNYYLTQADAEGSVNPIANPTAYDNISNPQTIYYQLSNAGDCFIVGNFDLIVQPLTDIVFNLPTQVCQNGAVPTLPTTSDNNISGTWTPAVVNNVQTQTYTFVANSNTTECTVPYEITIEVLEQITPTFLAPAPICTGDVAPVLPLTSNNGVTGTWSPSVVSNTQTQTYTFTPTDNPCATTTQIVVTVYQDCSFGSYANAVWLTDCDTDNFFNTVGSGSSIIGPAENIFPNTDLGTYVSNSNSLKLRGAEIKTFKAATANVCSATLFYRIYPVSGTPGTFSSINLPFLEDCNAGSFPSGGPCNPGDQKWQEVLNDSENPIDLTAYPAGEYNLEVYYQLVGDVTSPTECDDTLLIDNNGANFIATYTLQNNPTYTFVNPTDCSATDGSITIENLAPNTSYSLTYENNSTAVGPMVINSNNSGSYTLSGLSIGVYSNFNYLVNGCSISSTDVITLNSQSTLQITSTNPTTCNSNTGSITINGLLPNQSYNVSYTDDTSVVGPNTMMSDSNGQIVLTGLNAGTYTDFDLATTNCTAVSNEVIVLVNPGAPIVSVNSSSICAGQTTTVTATPAVPGTYTYTWTVPAGVTNPGNVASFTTTVEGTYTVVITPLSTTFCNGSFETPAATGPYPNMINQTLVPCWSTTAPDGIFEIWPPAGFEGVFAYQGNNFIEINGNSTASVYQDFTTSPGAQLNISFAHRGRQGTDVVGVEIGPTGGPYISLGNFSDGPTWQSYNLPPYNVPTSSGSNYRIRFVSVSSAGGDPSVGNFLDAVSVTSLECSSAPTSGSVTLLPSVTMALTTANNDQTVCINNSIVDIVYSSQDATNISVSGLPIGVNGTFDSTSGNFTITGTPTESGTFNYAVTAINDCNNVVLNGTLLINPSVTPTFTPITICNGDTLTLPTTSLEGITGTWSPAVNNTATTTYTFTPDNSSQCGISTTFTVNVNQPVIATFNSLTAICSGETAPSLPATSLEGFTGTWSPSTISNTASGTYTFTPNAGQCAAVGTLNFVVNPLIVSTFNNVSICQGENISFPVTSNENYTGTWSPNVIDNTQSGSYTFTPNAGQCAANGVWNITVLPTFDFEILGSCVGSNYTLEVNPLNNSFDLSTSNFTWYNSNLQMVGGNDATFNVSQYINSTTEVEEIPITFSVTVTNADGCTFSKSFTINNVACQIQKGISANGDGLNDSFELSGFDVKKLTIYNRYGMKVYSKNQYTNQWVGQADNGDELPDGTYYYVIEFNGGGETKTGWIYINREQ
ncbi:choice-of-anchor L domain-containing protein [Flavobacterium capsici]|uniref:Choice-of-anchor L domain-containing protein n=1 Tax=Flavobacterium capsici TaxID=3075618 RepID=A0AA96F4F1_9FLAO|nr:MULTISPECIES: choice-of-anchor L domain-containing protein [unclassified Flavobacterium]WNM18541.1 choice-of-anchor L domain-containing protein [Flavobacterium sp. PMR2A8]WNM22592.1 choice-of-anchor L domain-containing protein [Flavobacterium sp. PMTSA4]